MDRYTLVGEIINFCVQHGVFDDDVDYMGIKTIVEKNLDDPAFVESLINTIILKAEPQDDIDSMQVKTLLLELERVRLEHEYQKTA